MNLRTPKDYPTDPLSEREIQEVRQVIEREQNMKWAGRTLRTTLITVSVSVGALYAIGQLWGSMVRKGLGE